MDKRKKNHFSMFLPQLKEQGVLLHTCCSPCAVEAVDRMVLNDVSLQLYFYNPNITNPDEYQKRLKEVQKLASFYHLPLFEDVYHPKDFLCLVKGLENEPEKGKRCDLCFQMRLKRLKDYAQSQKIAYTTSVLGVSRWKDFDQTVRVATATFLSGNGTTYLPINWRKENSEPQRLALIKKHKIYQQTYCGCPFSKH